MVPYMDNSVTNDRHRQNSLSYTACNIPGYSTFALAPVTHQRHSREPPVGLVLLWFAGLSVPLLPEVFENFINTVDITHRSFPFDPINYDGPFERLKIPFRLGKELVGRGRGAVCDETR